MAGIPAGFAAVLDAMDETQAIRDVREWLVGKKAFGLLAGAKGRGKSIALAHAVDTHGGLYVEAFNAARIGMYDDAWDDLILSPLLALDEMEMAPADEKGWSEAKLYNLLSSRFQHGRRTLLATNLGAREFQARYGTGPLERLWDRMTSSWDVFAYTGPSMRGEP